jgi:antagonist of KipI
MSISTLEILEPGLLTTVQDRGRYGYQRHGVPVSGAMDEFALRMANLMVGNDQNAAALEIAVQGPKIEFLAETWITVTGADLSPTLDDKPIPHWRSVEVKEDSILAFGDMRDGMRAYLAVHGGIDVPVIMGSRSTYIKGNFGGLDGRILRKSDQLATLPVYSGDFVPKQLPKHYTAPVYGGRHRLRVILGPQNDEFKQEAISKFLGSRYKIASESDRMGYMLDGPTIDHITAADIVSDGNPLGAIQIPGDGVPRILLADRGTTGGYTKIATVITADLSRLAQALPGQTVSFQPVSVEEAQKTLRTQEAIIRSVERQGQIPVMSISLGGDVFEVQAEDGQSLTQQDSIGSHTDTVVRRMGVSLNGESYGFSVEVRREA